MLVQAAAAVSVLMLAALIVALVRHGVRSFKQHKRLAWAALGYAVLVAAGGSAYCLDLASHWPVLGDASPAVGLLALMGVVVLDYLYLLPAALAPLLFRDAFGRLLAEPGRAKPPALPR